MQDFLARINAHVEHVKKVGSHCTTEETTKQALILPMLDILGFSPYDPTKVKAEHVADFQGAKSNERVDYALFCHGSPVMLIEAKAYTEKLSNHAPQLSRYFNATLDIKIAAITNGKEWRFFTDLNNKNVMDSDPFLIIDFISENSSDHSQLYRFRHDEFQPEALRTLAEQSIYLNAFKGVISKSLKEVDADFVRYVASRSSIQRQLNAKFVEYITPLVRQAVERAVSEMVVSGLSAPTQPQLLPSDEVKDAIDPTADEINPENTKIVTTHAERMLLAITKEILGQDTDIMPKDTESYYTILYQGKVNRWILRFYTYKKRPCVQFVVVLDENRMNEIKRAGLEVGNGGQVMLDKPENLMRLSGILYDCLAYCQNDENFKIKKP